MKIQRVKLDLMRAGIISFIILLAQLKSLSQNVHADFSLPSSACLDERIYLINQSTGATDFEWDFCQGDLSLTPNASVIANLNGSVTIGIDIVFDGENWYGFVTNRGTNSILRLEFGSSLYSVPIVTDLGNISNMILYPSDIKVVFDGGNWYGFVYGYGSPAIVRIDFGNSLLNTTSGPSPISASVVVSTTGSINGGFDMIYDGSNWTIVYIQDPYLNIVRLNSINATPAGQDFISNVLDAFGSGLGDVVLQKVNGKFYGYVVSASNTSLQRMEFGANVFSTPVISDVTGYLPQTGNPYGVDITFDNGKYYLLISTIQGNLYKVDLGDDLSASPIKGTDLGTLSILTNMIKLKLVKEGTSNFLFSTDYGSTNLFSLNFPNPSSCPANVATSTDTNPEINYTASGVQYISLKSYDGGSVDQINKSLVVNANTAPDIDYTHQNVCAFNNVDFLAINQSGDLISYSWDFGDGGSSSSSNPAYIYSSPGNYNVELTVTAANGCQNTVQEPVQIFNPPQANFNLPSASPICSNQTYSFNNTSTFDNGSNPTWQWNVNGTDVATTQDLTYVIPSPVAQNVILTASIPGCSSQATQNIPAVQDGPLVNFSSPPTGCVNAVASFVNSSTGTITNYSWDFGDGNSSSQTNATNTYSSAGNFGVTLTASNTAGCQNFLTKNFPVYSNPQPDFAIEAPPYSCANYPAQFDNSTPPLSDSNITTWAWSFGDAANGTSNQKNPSYTYASAAGYSVTLQATSNFGCGGSKQQNVTIFSSPQSGFTNTPACVNQNTQFTDASTGSVTSYQWVIQGTIFSGANPPPYVFKTSGTFPVSLTTTSGNNCKNQLVKNINVPVPPVMDFTYQLPCTNNPTIFQELNPGGPDPSVAWNWNFGSDSGTGSPVSFMYPTVGVYSVTLSATRNSGCIYSTSKNIAIYEGPVAAFTPSTQGGAAPLTVTFDNTSMADSYFWQFGDTNNSTSSDLSPEFTYTQLGEYKALLTASDIHSCIDTLSTKIYVVIPNVDLAMKNFSLANDPNSNSSKPVVTILNLGNIPLTNPEVQIDLGGNAVLKEKIISTILPGKSLQQTLNVEIVPQTLGYICAEVTSSGDVDIYNDRQCISMNNDDVLFYPYPNPAKGQINFDWISSENEDVTVTIYKSTGQVAFNQNFQFVQSGINQLAIDISSLSSGLYLIQFSGAKTKKTFSVSVIN